jgi:hypothetical protein
LSLSIARSRLLKSAVFPEKVKRLDKELCLTRESART